MRGGLTTQRERSFHGQTLGTIVRTIADEVGLIPLVAKQFADQVLAHVDQTNESAANLLTRLARMYDAIATVKDGKLLLFPAAGGVTASGLPLPAVSITRAEGDSHRFSLAERGNYTHVRATWHDIGQADKGEVIWGKDEDAAERSRRPIVPAPASSAAPTAFKAVGAKQKSRGKALRLATKEWKRLSKSADFRARYAGVKVAYDDRTLKTQGEVTHGLAEDKKARQNAQRTAERDAAKIAGAAPAVAIDHSADNIKTLRHVYANKANAVHACRAEWRRLQRGMASFGITLAHGREDIFPELPATVSGFKPAIDNTDWLVTRVTHSGGEGGFTSAVELEIRATEVPG
jgi:phage protein D